MVHRNRYLEGTEDGPMTPRGYPNFNSCVNNLCFLVLHYGQTEGRMEGWTETFIWGGLEYLAG
jgi:hypothetical protein